MPNSRLNRTNFLARKDDLAEKYICYSDKNDINDKMTKMTVFYKVDNYLYN